MTEFSIQQLRLVSLFALVVLNKSTSQVLPVNLIVAMAGGGEGESSRVRAGFVRRC